MAETSPSMSIRSLRAITLLALSPMLACLAARPVEGERAGTEGAPLGAFTIASQTFGDLILTATECAAGDRQSFLGADLTRPGAPVVLRLVVDPLEGPAVRLYAAQAMFDRSVVFRRSECRTFHFSIERTGWRVNDVEDIRLTLELDCARDGESVRGAASSTHCH
jgi:hypothetical protein